MQGNGVPTRSLTNALSEIIAPSARFLVSASFMLSVLLRRKSPGQPIPDTQTSRFFIPHYTYQGSYTTAGCLPSAVAISNRTRAFDLSAAAQES